MRVRKVKGMHESGVRANIFAPVVGEPTADLHDDVGGEAAGSEVGCTPGAKRLSCCVIWKIRL